jgi:hypothetical protein
MLEAVFRYCERGTVTGAFAEPVNVLSNGAFLVVAIVLWLTRCNARDAAIAVATAAVAAGSTVFHMTAQRWAELADVVPIGLVLAVLGWAVLVDVVGLTRRASVFALGVTGAAMAAAARAMIATGCDRPHVAVLGGREVLQPLATDCLNGGWVYVPAAVALWLASSLSYRRGHAGRCWLIMAATAFTTGFAARALDLVWCPPGVGLSLHALWHGAAATTVYCLARAIKARRVPRSTDQ